MNAVGPADSYCTVHPRMRANRGHRRSRASVLVVIGARRGAEFEHENEPKGSFCGVLRSLRDRRGSIGISSGEAR